MARSLATALAPLVRHDGAWLRCAAQGCDAYWGDFRPTAWVAAKAQQHAAKAHGAKAPKAQAGRPQRRAAAAQAPDVSVLAVNAFMSALRHGAPARLGRGVSREVFPFGPDHVLKVPNNGTGAHNLAEFNAYATAPAAMRRLLAPALKVAPDGSWLLMQAATRIGEATRHDCDKLAAALGHKIGDLHPDNIGWLDGRWVAIDYAGGWAAREVRW